MKCSQLFAEELCNAVNRGEFDANEFWNHFNKEHKTIQQMTIKALFMGFVEIYSSAYFDERNQNSVEFAKKLKKFIEDNDICFPLI